MGCTKHVCAAFTKDYQGIIQEAKQGSVTPKEETSKPFKVTGLPSQGSVHALAPPTNKGTHRDTVGWTVAKQPLLGGTSPLASETFCFGPPLGSPTMTRHVREESQKGGSGRSEHVSLPSPSEGYITE
ncbi:hypothetical protein JTE90_014995 [Oedothorax gibbosus]|uniref:Uncharacterized protein n=1 Tax=Oedothorax gibbosus TaxID=931172 RepID=A0AAV6UYN6_9ARAC|nr:hypothetical protein JTE90_014995 [Oedothorax gibbosus]